MKVKVRIKNVKKNIEKFKNMKNPDFILGRIEKDMAKEVNLRFRNESGPDGKAWASLSAGTILRRYNPEKGLGTTQKSVRRMKKRGWKNGQIEKAFHLQKGTDSKLTKGTSGIATKGVAKILQNTGRLKKSINSAHDNKEAKVGTNLIYATTHNYGLKKKNIPARPFMGLSMNQKLRYQEWIRKWKRGEL